MDQTPTTSAPPPAPAHPQPPRNPYKAMGVSNVFFGMLAEIAALANYSAGMGHERAILSALMGATLLVMGITLIQKRTATRP